MPESKRWQSVIRLKDRNCGERPQRAAHAKVRTGCVTCKKRRVKCDEGRPGCNACAKFGTRCEGYIHIPTRVLRYEKDPSARKLLPLQRELLPSFHLESRIDQLYFQYYREEVAPCIGGVNFSNSSDLWSRKMLQAGFGHSWIYDAIVAIAALNVSMRGSSKVAGLATEKESHYAAAVRRYGRAIIKMRACLSTNTDIRKAILGCLLVFGFEGFHGDQRMALSHVMSANELLQWWLAGNPDVEIRNGAVCRAGVVIVEEDVISTFMRLHLQALSVVHRLQTPITDSVPADIIGDKMFYNMPERMEDFPQALRLINYVLRRITQYGTFATKVTIANTVSHGGDERMAQIFLDKPTSSYVACFTALGFPYPCEPTPPTIAQEYERNLRVVNRMSEASKHLYESDDPAYTPGSQYLQVGLFSARLFLDFTKFPTENEFDKHLESFRTMIRLLRELVRYFEASMPPATGQIGTSGPFGMDPGLLPMLYLIAKCCRDSKIRREAIQLMKMGPRRAGIWDVVLTVKVLEWLIKKEENGAGASGFIPEEDRVRILRIDTLDKDVHRKGEREVTIIYGMRGRDRRVHIKRDIVMWNPDGDDI